MDSRLETPFVSDSESRAALTDDQWVPTAPKKGSNRRDWLQARIIQAQSVKIQIIDTDDFYDFVKNTAVATP